MFTSLSSSLLTGGSSSVTTGVPVVTVLLGQGRILDPSTLRKTKCQHKYKVDEETPTGLGDPGGELEGECLRTNEASAHTSVEEEGTE